MTKIYEVNKPMGINKIKIKIKLIKPYLVPFTLRGFFKLHKIFGLLGATWGSFFFMLPKIFGHSGSIPEKMFSRMLEKIGAFLEFKVCLGRL